MTRADPDGGAATKRKETERAIPAIETSERPGEAAATHSARRLIGGKGKRNCKSAPEAGRTRKVGVNGEERAGLRRGRYPRKTGAQGETLDEENVAVDCGSACRA